LIAELVQWGATLREISPSSEPKTLGKGDLGVKAVKRA
jgi:hypothetical protein